MKNTATDASAATSLLVWLTSHALEWMPVLQWLSLCIVIITGTCSAVSYLVRFIRWIQQRRKPNGQ